VAAKLPEQSQVWNAIEIYLRHAYEGAQPSVTVRSLLETLRSWKGDFFGAPIFARTPPQRYCARLGNAFYPHMKLVFEPSPDGEQFLFKADTHDRHVCPPPESPEHAAFRALMDKNQRLAEAIEGDWSSAGLPTFKTYLRDDLSRRQRSGSSRGAAS
jgi:hypothetical protein